MTVNEKAFMTVQALYNALECRFETKQTETGTVNFGKNEVNINENIGQLVVYTDEYANRTEISVYMQYPDTDKAESKIASIVEYDDTGASEVIAFISQVLASAV